MLYSVRVIIKERLLSHVVTFGLVLCLDQEIRWKVELVSKLFGASKTLDWALSLMEMVIILPPQSSIPSRSQAASRNDSSIDVRYVRYVSYIRIHISSYLILGWELKCLAFGPIPQDSFHLFSLLHFPSFSHDQGYCFSILPPPKAWSIRLSFQKPNSSFTAVHMKTVDVSCCSCYVNSSGTGFVTSPLPPRV